jgi:hypothetical protein
LKPPQRGLCFYDLPTIKNRAKKKTFAHWETDDDYISHSGRNLHRLQRPMRQAGVAHPDYEILEV